MVGLLKLLRLIYPFRIFGVIQNEMSDSSNRLYIWDVLPQLSHYDPCLMFNLNIIFNKQKIFRSFWRAKEITEGRKISLVYQHLKRRMIIKWLKCTWVIPSPFGSIMAQNGGYLQLFFCSISGICRLISTILVRLEYRPLNHASFWSPQDLISALKRKNWWHW